QSTLAVSEYGGVKVWTFHIEQDGSLTGKDSPMTMRTPLDKTDTASGDGMTTDTMGRYYVATMLGVQVFEPKGRLLGVISPPSDKRVTSVSFAGPNLEYLYVTSGDKIFRRKTQAKGVLF